MTARRTALSGTGFLLLGATLIQWSATIVEPAFGSLGATATSGWRFLLGAVVLLLWTRPNLRRFTREQWRGALILGIAVAFMNQCFYMAISRIPLGGAVAIEYMGPLVVAALGKRSGRHLALVALAGLGVLSLTHPGGGITLIGFLFAAGSGLGWALYVFASHRVGAQSKDFGGLALSMTIAALVTLPMSMSRLSVIEAHPALLARMTLVATMAIVLGFASEMQALRRLRPSTVGVLMALDPAIAFVLGLAVLRQGIGLFDGVGLAAVVVAGVGVTWDSAAPDEARLR